MKVNESRSKREAIDLIEGIIPELNLHIMKYWLLPNERARHHWKVDEILPRILKIYEYGTNIKTRNKVISLEVLKDEYSGYFEYNVVRGRVRVICEKYGLNNKLMDIENIQNKLIEFYDELWVQVSSKSLNLDWFIEKLEDYYG